MLKMTHLCTDCVQPITNPLCPSCSARGLIAWVRDRDLKKAEMKKVRKLLRKLIKDAEENPSAINCIACDSLQVNLCVYCFTNRTKNIIVKSVEDEKVVEKFKEDFNVDIWLLRY
ncbi:hypothetical protein GOV13_04100 [Candidatus Pacearchaeota archaeon]|nr:hypothetical protein [Candidatus Pacearchaeota archaeon]